ncbi:hypothetical protein [Apilactobacillus zhangqiuensis]|uniref:hypothetical protein n=1 Tax=Apilactobacillus zhangqiuensis TaxID=2841031 RepID=UPI0009C10B01|nr:hypothetical protein [Apilactobacillus zhangqiuensis]WKN28914.1 DUF2187 domain-containing protein [Apilactobacillus kunkeei]
MVKDKLTSNDKSPFDVGDQVSFMLEKKKFQGIIEKGYNNSYMIGFQTTDPALEDKYHGKIVINNKNITMVKEGPHNSKGKNQDSEATEDEEK